MKQGDRPVALTGRPGVCRVRGPFYLAVETPGRFDNPNAEPRPNRFGAPRQGAGGNQQKGHLAEPPGRVPGETNMEANGPLSECLP